MLFEFTKLKTPEERILYLWNNITLSELYERNLKTIKNVVGDFPHIKLYALVITKHIVFIFREKEMIDDLYNEIKIEREKKLKKLIELM